LGMLAIPFWATRAALPGWFAYSATEAITSVAHAHSTPQQAEQLPEVTTIQRPAHLAARPELIRDMERIERARHHQPRPPSQW